MARLFFIVAAFFWVAGKWLLEARIQKAPASEGGATTE
jgi:hypothetical protein